MGRKERWGSEAFRGSRWFEVRPVKCQFKARQLCITDESLLLRVGRCSGCTVTRLGWDRTLGLGLQLGKVRVGSCFRVWVRVGGLGFRLGLDCFEMFR